jgi:hypothetical protein
MPNMQRQRAVAAVVPPARRAGGHPPAEWRQDVALTVIAVAAKMGPDELTMRAVAHRMGLQDPQVWRVLPKGRADILFLVAADLPHGSCARSESHPVLARRWTAGVRALRAEGGGRSAQHRHWPPRRRKGRDGSDGARIRFSV